MVDDGGARPPQGSPVALRDHSDAELVAALPSDSGGAWAELFRRHAASVHRAARLILGNHPDCGDVVMVVFEGLWRSPERFDPERGSLLGYLRQQARSRAIDVLRADGRRKRREVAGQGPVGLGDRRDGWSDDPQDLVVAQQGTAQLWDLVARLPDNERRAIEMAFVHGMTYASVAANLSEPEGTVKSRIRRGLERLRTSSPTVESSAPVSGGARSAVQAQRAAVGTRG